MKYFRNKKFIPSLLLCSILTAVSACNNGNGSGVIVPTPTPKIIPNGYVIAIDSGSQGNRVYLYKYDIKDASTKLDISVINLDPSGADINKNNIPLAGFALNPTEAGNGAIKPLLELAEAKLKDLNVNRLGTEVVLQGTAGMRLISQPQQDAIYNSVKDVIVKEGFMNPKVGTLSGEDEAVDTWMDYNFLDGDFTATNTTTSGTVEMGGASAQIAFNTTDTLANHVREYTILGQTYHVYGVSYLGFGVNQAREHGGQVDACYPVGYNISPITGAFVYNTCNTSYDNFINSYSNVTEIKAIKNIAGFATTEFAGLGGIWDTAKLVSNSPTQQSLKKSKRIKNNPLKASTLTAAITEECSRTLSQITTDFAEDSADAPTFCPNAVFADNIVFNTLGIQDNKIQAYNKINISETDEVKINWTLGYVLNEHFANLK